MGESGFCALGVLGADQTDAASTPPFESKKMTNKNKIDLIMLLSAMESWSFSVQSRFPDYLHDKLCNAVELLTNEVLETK